MMIIMNKKEEKFEEIREFLINLKILQFADSHNKEEKTIFYIPSSANNIKITLDDDNSVSFNLDEVELLSLSPNGILIQHLGEMYPFELFKIKNIEVK